MPKRSTAKHDSSRHGPRASVQPKKPYWEMTTVELAEATREFDADFDDSQFKPLTPEQRANWDAARLKPGRPKNGRGVKVISLSVEKGLLSRADRLAKKLKISRAKLVSRGLEILLVQKATQ